MIGDVISGAYYHVEASDCFDFAARIPDGAVNLLWLDGPYNMGKAAWDTFAPADFLAFYDRLLVEARRILAPNGSLYLCNSTANAARLECLIAERFTVLNSIRWAKHDGAGSGNGAGAKCSKAALRSFFPQSEAIVFGAPSPEYSVEYLRDQCSRAGITPEALSAFCGFKPTGGSIGPRRYLSAEGFAPIARADYDRLQRETEYFARSYDSLYRPFSVSSSVPYTDTWTYATVPTQAGKHLAEKPADMLRDVIAASSRPGDLVCELFAGSGVGGEQAILAGRRYLGCDSDPEWAARTRARIERAEREPHKAGRPVIGVAAHTAQGRLL